MHGLRCLFFIQGEGRGHMTQALALRALLAAAGHEVCGALVGRSARRELPAFFVEGLGAPVQTFESPNFVADGQDKSIRLGPTLLHNTRRAGAFRESLARIDLHVRLHAPDVLINFFEPLAGLYHTYYRPDVPMVCVGHQYMFHHPAYPFPAGRRVDRRVLQAYTELTARSATRRLALSFYPAPSLPERRLVVAPPLLRPEVLRAAPGRTDDFILVYLLNSGYAEELVRWHERRPDVRLHCFWDHRGAGDVLHYDDTLTFHRLNGPRFLDLMVRCRALACTAGFESVCEARYLGKPVYMVPVAGHFEQQCNALDATAVGAGCAGTRFDLDPLLDLLAQGTGPAPAFRRWVEGAGPLFLREIEAAAGRRPAAPRATPVYAAS